MIKSFKIRKGGDEEWLSAIKLPLQDLEIGGEAWIAPLPQLISAHDIFLIKRLVAEHWDIPNVAFDLDEWSASIEKRRENK